MADLVAVGLIEIVCTRQTFTSDILAENHVSSLLASCSRYGIVEFNVPLDTV